MAFAVRLVILLAALAGSAGAARAEDAAAFYRGKTVEIVVGFGPGGGFDIYARTLAPHLERRLGATVIVRNQPGGGGLTALNDLVRGAADGLSMMLVDGEGALLAQLVDKPGARYDLAAVTWLGRVNDETFMLLVGSRAPYRSVDDLMRAKEPITFAATDRIGGTGDAASIACAAAGLRCKLITGYKGSKEAALAVARGEADAISVSESTAHDLARGDLLIPVAAVAETRAPSFLELPALGETVSAAGGDTPWLALRDRIGTVGRAFVAAPGLPEGRVRVLVAAIADALTDPAVVAEAERLGRPIRYAPPEVLDDSVADVARAVGPDARQSLRDLLLTRY